MYNQPSTKLPINESIEGVVEWSSPSNIAIIKYWGKHGRQLPRNPSISFTLNKAKTTAKISYKVKSVPSDDIQLSLFFEGKRNEAFEKKMKLFFVSILTEMPFLNQLEFIIDSSNSFPHSAGIASSASAMSAIASCLCDIENRWILKKDKIEDKRVSYIARLGSGSASRSVFPTMAIWGKVNDLSIDTSDQYAVEYDSIEDIFKTYHDDILIVSKKEKLVSSSAGHQLMDRNIYADARYTQARDRMKALLVALKEGNQEKFGKIAEDEALTLHALMMSSDPSYLLIHPNTLNIISKVRSFREQSGLHLYFTLDAGPNVHLLYPDNEKQAIQKFIHT